MTTASRHSSLSGERSRQPEDSPGAVPAEAELAGGVAEGEAAEEEAAVSVEPSQMLEASERPYAMVVSMGP